MDRCSFGQTLKVFHQVGSRLLLCSWESDVVQVSRQAHSYRLATHMDSFDDVKPTDPQTPASNPMAMVHVNDRSEYYLSKYLCSITHELPIHQLAFAFATPISSFNNSSIHLLITNLTTSGCKDLGRLLCSQ